MGGERSGCLLPDSGGSSQTPDMLRRARPRASSPHPLFLRMAAPEALGDFMKSLGPARTLHPRWGHVLSTASGPADLGWKGWLPRSSPLRGFLRLPEHLVAWAVAGVAVAAAAAAWQLKLGSRPARDS